MEIDHLPAETLVNKHNLDRIITLEIEKVWLWYKTLAGTFRNDELGVEVLGTELFEKPEGGLALITEVSGVAPHSCAMELRALGNTLWVIPLDEDSERTSFRVIYPITGGPVTTEYIPETPRPGAGPVFT